MLPPPPRSTLFPYTTLFRSTRRRVRAPDVHVAHEGRLVVLAAPREQRRGERHAHAPARVPHDVEGRGDRKSTRLNSSHTVISYAVFCLKKKKKNQNGRHTYR